MLKIKSNPTYSVTVKLNVDGVEKTAAAYDLTATEAEHLDQFLNEETLNSFLDYRFRRHFCEALVDIPFRQAQDAQLMKEHIARSFMPGDQEDETLGFGKEFEDVFLWMVDELQKDGLIETYYDFNSDYLRMIEPTKVGHALIQMLFGQ